MFYLVEKKRQEKKKSMRFSKKKNVGHRECPSQKGRRVRLLLGFFEKTSSTKNTAMQACGWQNAPMQHLLTFALLDKVETAA